ncbi:ribosome biogenesis GTPase YqeH, partial [Brevibacillus choshinensis]
QGQRQPFIVYVDNDLYIHRTKLDKADEVMEKHHGSLLVPPTGEEAAKALPPFIKHTFKIRPTGTTDIVISGLGWVSLQGKHDASVVVHAPKGVSVGIRKGLI